MITRTRFIVGAATIAALFTTACSDAVTSPTRAQPPAFAAQGGVGGGGGIAGGGGGGGVTVAATGFGGNWSGTIGNPTVGLGLFTMKLSVVGTTVTGQLRAGAPVFDSGFNMNSGSLTSPTTMVGSIARSQGFIEVTGTLSADGTTITGIFYSNGPNSYPYTVTRQ